MVSREELLKWINELESDAVVGIDEDGLALLAISPSAPRGNIVTGMGADGAHAYFEVGGMPHSDGGEE